MDIVYSYSHLGGEEILIVRYPQLNRHIEEVVASIPSPGRSKVSLEKTKRGKKLYSPKQINALFRREFRKRGWQRVRDTFDIALPHYPHVVKGAYKECDFCKDQVFVEVQFGKYAFMFYDLAKFQYFYNQRMMQVGVEIVPCHFLQRQMSSGVSYGEQLVQDLERLSKNFPSVPVRIILVDMPLEDQYHLEERKALRQAYQEVRKTLSAWQTAP